MNLTKLALAVAAASAIVSGCQYKGSCGKSYENMDYSTVHFGFDQDHLTTHAMMKLDKQAHHIMHHTMKSDKPHDVVVEGHTDERGSREYNLALGARRAHSVKNYLVNKGVDAKIIQTVSYGKEKPVDTGHDEAAWAKNRRVHFNTK